MSTFFVSLTTVVGLLSNQSQMIGFWVSGGFRNASWADFKLVFIVGIIGLLIAVLLSGKINILSLGDDVAIGCLLYTSIIFGCNAKGEKVSFLLIFSFLLYSYKMDIKK